MIHNKKHLSGLYFTVDIVLPFNLNVFYNPNKWAISIAIQSSSGNRRFVTVDSVVVVLLVMYDINGTLQGYLTLVITRPLNLNNIIEVVCFNEHMKCK